MRDVPHNIERETNKKVYITMLGVVVSLLITKMAIYYFLKGRSLYEGLQELYEKYG